MASFKISDFSKAIICILIFVPVSKSNGEFGISKYRKCCPNGLNYVNAKPPMCGKDYTFKHSSWYPVEAVRNNSVDASLEVARYQTISTDFPCKHYEHDLAAYPSIKTIPTFSLFTDGNLLVEYPLTNSIRTFSPSQYCLDAVVNRTNRFVAVTCPCFDKLCLRKCCGVNQWYNDQFKCVKSQSLWVPTIINGTSREQIWISDDTHHVFFKKRNCINGKNPLILKMRNYSLYAFNNGSFSIHGYPSGLLSAFEFCLDHQVDENGEVDEVAAVCEKDEVGHENGEKHVNPLSNYVKHIFPPLFIISAMFFGVTLIIHFMLPELRNRHGFNIMGYTASFTFAFIFLAANLLQDYILGEGEWRCKVRVYFTSYFFLSAFFWMNVMCFDMCRTLSVLRVRRFNAIARDKTRFIIYCAYAWGYPAIVVLITVIVDQCSGVGQIEKFEPGIGLSKCWFQDSFVAEFLYFRLHQTFVLVANAGMFGFTTYRLVYFYKQTSTLNEGASAVHKGFNKREKHRFFLYFKLFLVMGLAWILEIIHWTAGGDHWLWYIADLINSLQGPLVFLLIVFKKKTVTLLKFHYKWLYWIPGAQEDMSVATESSRSRSSGKRTPKEIELQSC